MAMNDCIRPVKAGIGAVVALALLIIGSPEALAACGATTCFVVIGSQQQVPQKGLLTANLSYNYTPYHVQEGTNGIIPHANQERKRLTLDNHQEIRSILQTYTLDLNYGLTERFGLEVTVPYVRTRHRHLDELGEANAGAGNPLLFTDNGIGDIRLTAKYNLLPTLRSMLVMGVGVSLPTGDYNARDQFGGLMEPTVQAGRGATGLIGSVYQTYEVIPHRLNQFSFASYRHTFRNSDGYQFGDEYLLNLGVNLVTVPWLVLTSQFNYRYLTHDSMDASLRQSLPPVPPGGDPITIDPNITNRAVPNTGSTYLAYTLGFLINLGETTEFYSYAQIPIARDFNNNLVQGVSYVVGITRFFQVSK